MINIRLPSITADTEAGKLKQMQSYMYQLVEQLNWALSNVDSGTLGYAAYTSGTGSSASDKTNSAAQATFNSIKSLIIKSADVVNAYYDVIRSRLEGVYVAESDFGVYAEQTASEIEANSTGIEQLYENMQVILTDIESLEHSIIEVNAHINSGLLYYDDDGVPVYGLEVGQRTEIDGQEVFNKYAQFTASKLSFFDSNGNEVAYISDKKLYITHVEVTGSFALGGFVDTVMDDRSVVTKWVEV